MKFNRKTHFTERQLCDLSGLTIDALRVRAKTDPKFPEVLFVNNAQQLVYNKDAALDWITWMSHKKEQPLEVVPARQPKPLSQHGEYNPCRSMVRNLERTEKLYPHSLASLKGKGNYNQYTEYMLSNGRKR